jgi:ADP-ribosylglycohydrolase
MTKDKVIGMFLGVAIGDALGMPVEKMGKEEIEQKFGRIMEYIPTVDHKWHGNVPAGTWTDDTRLTLVVAEALIAARKFDMDEIARRHVEALQNAERADWGPTTREAIQRLASGIHWSESAVTGPNRGFGNGVVMKMSPLAVYLDIYGSFRSRCSVADIIKQFTFMTHKTDMALAASFAHYAAIQACLSDEPRVFDRKYFLGVVSDSAVFFYDLWERFEHLRRVNDQTLLADILSWFPGHAFSIPVSIPVSYAAFLKNPTSVEALYDAVALGGDTDSNASITGSLLGALNGTAVFPKHLIDGLRDKEKVLDVAERFCYTFNVR